MDAPRVSVRFEAIIPPLRIRIDDLTGTVLAKVLQDHLRDVLSLFSPRLHKSIGGVRVLRAAHVTGTVRRVATLAGTVAWKRITRAS